MDPTPPSRSAPVSRLDRQAALVGLALVVAGVIATALAWSAGATVTAVLVGAAVVAWLLIPAVPVARTFRWNAETTIRRPVPDVVAFFADPEQEARYEAAGDYDPSHPGHGPLEIEVLERAPGRVRYRQVVGTGRGGPLVAEVERTVDTAQGVVRSRMLTNQGAGDVVEVTQAAGGSRVVYATEIRVAYLTALVGVWLMHGRFERRARARLEGVLARIKAAMESGSPD